MKELETKIEELDRKILIEKSKNNSKLTEEDIQKYYLKALKLEPFILINYLIKNIVVYKDKLEITFNSPIQKSPEINQGFIFYSNTKLFPKYIQNKTIPNYLEMQVNIYV